MTAESCTAGALAQAFATGEGASQWFHGGIVTYTKQMKTRALGVPTSLLIEKTAVSAEVALAMVRGCIGVFTGRHRSFDHRRSGARTG